MNHAARQPQRAAVDAARQSIRGDDSAALVAALRGAPPRALHALSVPAAGGDTLLHIACAAGAARCALALVGRAERNPSVTSPR